MKVHNDHGNNSGAQVGLSGTSPALQNVCRRIWRNCSVNWLHVCWGTAHCNIFTWRHPHASIILEVQGSSVGFKIRQTSLRSTCLFPASNSSGGCETLKCSARSVCLCGTFTKWVLFYVFAELQRCYPLYSWHGQTGTHVNLMFQPGAGAAGRCDWSYLSSLLLDSAQWPFPSMGCLPEQRLDFSSQSNLIGSKRHFS